MWEAGPNKDLLRTHLNPNALYTAILEYIINHLTKHIDHFGEEIDTKTRTRQTAVPLRYGYLAFFKPKYDAEMKKYY